ncbi:PAAR domain-containing protein [Rahnella woolbedingensis]|uniref:PAAR domain-containing protein n=1 Tax=Rahnella woolbedingensis TaxID=1510574 RepID=A0A419N1U3_9GAMM|nr:PAAR domain-containing protein [Rahnella woolbedingensis]RJT32042.1 PAAR domain-containing protein [Rahnella woolbedingensis]
MPYQAVILKGDKTSHGGTVLEGFAQVTHVGIPVAGIGHSVSCPACDGVFPIVDGTPKISFCGLNLAVEGMQTACGARLIASQQEFVA